MCLDSTTILGLSCNKDLQHINNWNKKRVSLTMEPSERKKKTCCFTGHRDLPVNRVQEIADRTEREIRNLIVNHDVRYFGVGGAIGYDTLAAKILFYLKETEFPHIRIILVYPFDGFTSRWAPDQKAEYERLLPRYDKIVCAGDRAGRDAYLARDRHLVDCSAYCIAYCTRNDGGTAYTVRYAGKQGVKVRNVSGSSF